MNDDILFVKVTNCFGVLKIFGFVCPVISKGYRKSVDGRFLKIFFFYDEW